MTVEEIFAEDRSHVSRERVRFRGGEVRDGMTVAYRAQAPLRRCSAFRPDAREYCYYADWTRLRPVLRPSIPAVMIFAAEGPVADRSRGSPKVGADRITWVALRFTIRSSTPPGRRWTPCPARNRLTSRRRGWRAAATATGFRHPVGKIPPRFHSLALSELSRYRPVPRSAYAGGCPRESDRSDRARVIVIRPTLGAHGDGPPRPKTGAGTHVLRRCRRFRRQPRHHTDGISIVAFQAGELHGAANESDGDDEMVKSTDSELRREALIPDSLERAERVRASSVAVADPSGTAIGGEEVSSLAVTVARSR